MKVLLTGATGLVGREVGKALAEMGMSVIAVSRKAERARLECPFPCEVIEGDLQQGPLSGPALAGIDAVVHLAGDPIVAGRWTEKKKSALVDSRVRATENLRRSVPGAKVVVAASAVGIYGDRGDEELTEDSALGSGFLAELCRSWEEAVNAFGAQGARTVSLRLSMVISRRGGALPELLTPFRAGVGGPLAGGRHWMSWVHVDDVVRAILFALETSTLRGAFNLASPNPVRNEEFTRDLGTVLDVPAFVPTPAAALRVLFGEKAQVLTASQRVVPKRLLDAGFRFHHVALREALGAELGEIAQGDELFEAEQYVPRPPSDLFPFFADAQNLGKITPPLLDFRILEVSTPEVQEGTRIDYRLKIHGVPVHWRTLIESWDPPRRFVDTQLKGPYSLWHHTHSFEALGEGTLMRDRVRYRVPFGVLGRLGGGAFVRGDVEKIFEYRRRAIAQAFGR